MLTEEEYKELWRKMKFLDWRKLTATAASKDRVIQVDHMTIADNTFTQPGTFADNSLIRGGQLLVKGNTTRAPEACQHLRQPIAEQTNAEKPPHPFKQQGLFLPNHGSNRRLVMCCWLQSDDGMTVISEKTLASTEAATYTIKDKEWLTLPSIFLTKHGTVTPELILDKTTEMLFDSLSNNLFTEGSDSLTKLKSLDPTLDKAKKQLSDWWLIEELGVSINNLTAEIQKITNATTLAQFFTDLESNRTCDGKNISQYQKMKFIAFLKRKVYMQLFPDNYTEFRSFVAHSGIRPPDEKSIEPDIANNRNTTTAWVVTYPVSLCLDRKNLSKKLSELGLISNTVSSSVSNVPHALAAADIATTSADTAGASTTSRHSTATQRAYPDGVQEKELKEIVTETYHNSDGTTAFEALLRHHSMLPHAQDEPFATVLHDLHTAVNTQYNKENINILEKFNQAHHSSVENTWWPRTRVNPNITDLAQLVHYATTGSLEAGARSLYWWNFFNSAARRTRGILELQKGVLPEDAIEKVAKTFVA